MTIQAWATTSLVTPDPEAGFYRDRGGNPLMPAHYLIDRVFPPPASRPAKNLALRQALAAYATARFRDGRQWQPAANVPLPVREQITALTGHSLWERFTVLAAPLHLGAPGRELATSADLLVRFAADDGLGLGVLQTAEPEQLHSNAVLAELGAAAAMFVDERKQILSRLFVVWVSPARVHVQAVKPDEAIAVWVDAMDIDRWMSRNGVGT